MTDIVEKEMYTFEDRNGDSLTLRPEGTAACVRAVLEHGITGVPVPTASPVPEPEMAWLLSAGLLGIAALSKRRQP